MNSNLQQIVNLKENDAQRTEGEVSADFIDSGLPWLPAFIKNEKKYWMSRLDDGDSDVHIKTIEGSTYGNSYRCQWLTEGDRVLVQYSIIVDGLFGGIHRLGGPAKYTYNIKTNLIEKMQWWHTGAKLTSFEYWEMLADSLPQIYNPKHYNYGHLGKSRSCMKLTTDRNVPHPSRIYVDQKRLDWIIDGQKVSMQKYWTYYEQMFSSMPTKAFRQRID